MIYYFTGTGNSLYIAQRLAELTGTGVASIAEIMNGKPMPEPEEISGIVYDIRRKPYAVCAWFRPRYD